MKTLKAFAHKSGASAASRGAMSASSDLLARRASAEQQTLVSSAVGSAKAEPEHAHDIRCENCGQLFDVMKAEVGERTMPNTLTGLKDHNNPWVKCPKCGYII